MFPKSGFPPGFIYFCPFAKTPKIDSRERLRSFLLLPTAGTAQLGPLQQTPTCLAESGRRLVVGGGPSADPSRLRKVNVGVFLAFG